MSKMLAYHGTTELHEDKTVYWFTTDPDHASYFGEVREATIWLDSSVVEIDADKDPRLSGQSGPEADEICYEIMEESDASALVLVNYEGTGLCILIDPRWIDYSWNNAVEVSE